MRPKPPLSWDLCAPINVKARRAPHGLRAQDVVEPDHGEGDDNEAQQQRRVGALARDARVANLPIAWAHRRQRAAGRDGARLGGERTCWRPTAQARQRRLTLPRSSIAGKRLDAQQDSDTPICAALALEPFAELAMFWL